MMRACKVSLGGAALAAILVAAAPAARADESPAAQALFDQAKRALAAHDYAQACPKFEESLRLQEAIGTMLNLADCYEQQGRLASAWSKFLEVATKARAAGQTARARVARDRAAALAPRLSNLVIEVAPASRVDGLEVRRDGTLVGEAEWSALIPADPGPHTVQASAPGRKGWTQTVTLSAGAATERVAVPVLELAPDAPIAAGEPGASPSSTPAPPDHPRVLPPAGEPARSGSGLRVAAWVLGGAGVAGLATGAAFGLLSLSKHNQASHDCPDKCTTVQDQNEWRDALNLGDVSTVAFVAGGVGLAASAVLFLVATRSSSAPQTGDPARPLPAWKDVRVAVGPTGVSAWGSW